MKPRKSVGAGVSRRTTALPNPIAPPCARAPALPTGTFLPDCRAPLAAPLEPRTPSHNGTPLRNLCEPERKRVDWLLTAIARRRLPTGAREHPARRAAPCLTRTVLAGRQLKSGRAGAENNQSARLRSGSQILLSPPFRCARPGSPRSDNSAPGAVRGRGLERGPTFRRTKPGPWRKAGPAGSATPFLPGVRR